MRLFCHSDISFADMLVFPLLYAGGGLYAWIASRFANRSLRRGSDQGRRIVVPPRASTSTELRKAA